MNKFTLTHEINCNVDTFWKMFFDVELSAKLFKEGLGFPDWRVVQSKDTETTFTRTTAVSPKLNLPGPVVKALGSSFSYTEDGTFDKAAKIWRWTMTPSALAGKMHTEGSLVCTPIGDAKVKRVIEISLEAKVFMIGGVIEDSFQKEMTNGWAKSATLMNEWLVQVPA